MTITNILRSRGSVTLPYRILAPRSALTAYRLPLTALRAAQPVQSLLRSALKIRQLSREMSRSEKFRPNLREVSPKQAQAASYLAAR
jgi:hypothetical protein